MLNNIFTRLGGLAVILLITAGCSGISVSISVPTEGASSSGGSSAGNPTNSSTGNSGNIPQFGVQNKTSGCQVNGKYPDLACTPGAIFNVTTSQVCTSGYSKGVRNVPESEKNQVYAEYGIASRTSGQYEVDHFVSLELGGSNDIANLWPEAASPNPGFHEKDKVENYLHSQMCNGAMTLQEAQREIATDWYAVYQRMGN